MKQLSLKTIKPGHSPPSDAKEIAVEFSRISKLKAEGKDGEAWRAANSLYAKYPDAKLHYCVNAG